MRYLTLSKVKYEDLRPNRRGIFTRPVLASTPAGAKRALGKSRGGPKNVVILEFNGDPVDDANLEQGGKSVDPIRRSSPVVIPSRQQIAEAGYQTLQQMVNYYRDVMAHREYFNDVRLNMKVEQLRSVIMERFYPPEGEEPPQSPKTKWG